jgi:lipopolysaccharide export system protein LptA
MLVLGFTCFASVKTPDAEQPVKITADSASFDQQKGEAVYSGNVEVAQGSRHLFSDKLTIKRGTDSKIEIMVASGNPARFRSQPDPNKPEGSGRAKLIKYYPELETVDLFNNAEITQDGNSVSGPMLKYNFATGNLKSTSNAKQRTTVILQPKRD